MTMSSNFTHVYANPGENSIIDAVNPDTGLTMVLGHTYDQVLEREPQAQMMTWEDWRSAQAQKQNTPIRWVRCDERTFNQMLGVLPPIDWTSRGFLVGEPTDHSYETGQPRYQAYLSRGGICVASSRPLTRKEWAEFK